jgi:hypothetical protein
MNLMKHLAILTILVILILALGTMAPAAVEKDDPPVRTFQERTYQGKPITFWLKALRERDEQLMSRAFEAIRSLDEDASIAVPDLMQIVAAPFIPIHIVKDPHAVIASKLYDIAVRTEAVDTLAWIGEPAAPAAPALIQWALMTRIIQGTDRTPDENELFIELVAMDAEQRMRVAGAIAAFGPKAYPRVAKLLTSSNAAKRKLSVAILNQDALPIAAELLRSNDCEERHIGLLVLQDMDLVVARSFLDELATQIRENCAMLTKVQ